MLNPSNANIVKSLHKKLRNKVKRGIHPNDVWNDLLNDTDCLKTYSVAMAELAQLEWPKDHRQSRIQWTIDTCNLYFFQGGMEKVTKKSKKQELFRDLKRVKIPETENEKIKIENKLLLYKCEWNFPLDNKLYLLDVGSCFNALKDYKDYAVYPVDIAPYSDDVYKLDFLNVKIESSLRLTSSHLSIHKNLLNSIISQSSFDIVLFSLFLSFFPSPIQRLQCCVNAHTSLRLHGLLVIITPDSSHQNKHVDMMRSWKEALEQVGFSRYKYNKLEHLHCMAYRKSSSDVKFDFKEYQNNFYIPQDFQDLDSGNIFGESLNSDKESVAGVKEVEYKNNIETYQSTFLRSFDDSLFS